MCISPPRPPYHYFQEDRFMAKPVCQYLRTKKCYIPTQASDNFLTETGSGSQYWCIRTMTVMGPDDVVVSPEDCNSRRACFDTVDIVFA